MKERPILFSTPMVKAILEGRKTQTRRIIKMPDLIEHPDWYRYIGNSNNMEITRMASPYDDRLYHEWQRVNSNAASWVIHSYKPGDILWVRETWAKGKLVNENEEVTHSDWLYKANNDFEDDPELSPGFKWRPSIFMPKEASRIKLEITDIRVERLQDISEEDAIAEGIEYLDNQLVDGEVDRCRIYFHYSDNELILLDAKSSYQTLWESINGKDSWGINPWVWVIEFKRIKP